MRIVRAAMLVLVVILGLAAPGIAQETGTQAMLFVEIRALPSDGAPARNAAISRVAKIGEVATTYVHAGRIEDPEGTLCSMRAAGATPQLTERDKKGMEGAAYVWKVTTTTAAFESGRLTVDVDWQRFDGGGETPTLSRKQRIILDEHRAYPLDFVRGSTPYCPAAVLELSSVLREDPTFADTVFRYDLWLVRHDKSGRKETRQLILSGVHGGSAEFQFAPLTSPVSKLQPDQFDFSVATRIRGAIRGRMTRDGRVSIQLQTQRSDRLERPGQPYTPPRSFGGSKTLVGGLGEAIEVQLPPADGFSSTDVSPKTQVERTQQGAGRGLGVRASADPKLPGEPIGVRDGRLYINYGPYLEGERLSLIVQVRKAEGAEAEPLAKR
jgi:hypothetical protein